MRILRSILIGMILGMLLSCAMMFREVRPVPKYTGVDKEVAPYVNEWLELAKIYHIQFYNTVTVGFTDIDKPEVIGECNYSYFFREIDLDKTSWKNFTAIRKTALVWHELVHAYCGRGHTYANEREYGNNDKEGFFLDTCPVSLMNPYVVEDFCFKTHYSSYVDDMFKNCKPY